MKDIHARKPIDGVAARVTGGGVQYQKDGAHSEELFDAPPPMRAIMPDASTALKVGHVFGWLMVIGIADKPSTPNRRASYVCRCRCGKFVYRKAKALRPHPGHEQFACGRCMHAHYLRRLSEFTRTGEWPPRTLEPFK